jgi:hypothetical protein
MAIADKAGPKDTGDPLAAVGVDVAVDWCIKKELHKSGQMDP